MDTDIKKLAKQQYFKYCRIWFIVLIIMVIVAAFLFVGQLLKKNDYRERGNDDAPSERVYDDAKVLSKKEEKKLSKLIEKTEREIECDIILVTINQPVENLSDDEIEEYGYRYNDWELNMQDIADDFYDHNEFGYDESGDDGDGILLLDNWYPDQEGTHISTSGKAFEKLGEYEIDRILDAVYKNINSNPYKAYSAYVKKSAKILGGNSQKFDIYGSGNGYLIGAILIPIIVAIAFILINRKSKDGKVTTTASTYVANGKPRINVSQDNFLRKNVTSRVIQTSSSSGGTRSGGGGGYGGGHRSSSGRSHGGGSRRR